jgi:hypothetical protein
LENSAERPLTSSGTGVRIRIKGYYPTVARVTFDGQDVSFAPTASLPQGTALSLDGEAVGTLRAGSAAIELGSGFVDRLANGEHVLEVYFEDSHLAGMGTAAFAIERISPNPGGGTGDGTGGTGDDDGSGDDDGTGGDSGTGGDDGSGTGGSGDDGMGDDVGDGIPTVNDPDDPDYYEPGHGGADDDGDGIPNINDPDHPNFFLPGGGGADDDGDGIPNINDSDHPDYWLPSGGGYDDDGDGVPNRMDSDHANYWLPGGGYFLVTPCPFVPWLIIALIVVCLLALFFFFLWWRRKKKEDEEEQPPYPPVILGRAERDRESSASRDSATSQLQEPPPRE